MSNIKPINPITFKGEFSIKIAENDKPAVEKMLGWMGLEKVQELKTNLAKIEQDTVEFLPPDDKLEACFYPVERMTEPDTVKEFIASFIGLFKPEKMQYLSLKFNYKPGAESKKIVKYPDQCDSWHLLYTPGNNSAELRMKKNRDLGITQDPVQDVLDEIERIKEIRENNQKSKECIQDIISKSKS